MALSGLASGQDTAGDGSRRRNPLTRKERELLAALKQNPGRCVSREVLLRTVWGYMEGVRSRTVDVHVQRLRRKLGPEESRFLKTIVGGGYCWLPDTA